MGDIKTRFKIEGEQQYRSAMNNAAAAIKVLNSEQKLAKAQFHKPVLGNRKLSQVLTNSTTNVNHSIACEP